MLPLIDSSSHLLRRDVIEIIKEIKSLINAFEVLEVFSDEEPELSLSVICRKTQMNKTTVFRYLQTLISMGYINQDLDTQKYSLGFKFFYLGSIVSNQMNLRKAALEGMKELHGQLGEAVALYILEGSQRICIEFIESVYDIRAVVQVGKAYSLAGSGARALFFNSDSSTTSAILSSTGFSKAEIEKYLQALEKDRERGYSASVEERVKGIFGVAAPILDFTGNVCASLTLMGPIARYSKENERLMGEFIVDVARKISQNLGAVG